jgi:hypothetical protein
VASVLLASVFVDVGLILAADWAQPFSCGGRGGRLVRVLGRPVAAAGSSAGPWGTPGQAGCRRRSSCQTSVLHGPTHGDF